MGVGKALSVRRVHEVGGWAGGGGSVMASLSLCDVSVFLRTVKDSNFFSRILPFLAGPGPATLFFAPNGNGFTSFQEYITVGCEKARNLSSNGKISLKIFGSVTVREGECPQGCPQGTPEEASAQGRLEHMGIRGAHGRPGARGTWSVWNAWASRGRGRTGARTCGRPGDACALACGHAAAHGRPGVRSISGARLGTRIVPACAPRSPGRARVSWMSRLAARRCRFSGRTRLGS